MGNVTDPWRFPTDGNFDSSGTGPHALAGLPIEIVNLIGNDLASTSGAFCYANHFYSWEGPVTEAAAGGWVLSGPTGAATIAGTAVSTGAIGLITDNTAGGVATLQYGPDTNHMPFAYAVGKRMWCFARLKTTTANAAEMFLGFGTADTSPCTTGTLPADGIFLTKAATDLDFTLHARKDGTSTTKATATGTTLADDTFVTVGFRVNSRGDVIPYLGAKAVVANIIAVGSANMPTAAADTLAFMVGHLAQNKTTTLDWLVFGAEI